MKKINFLFFLISIFALVSCSKDDNETVTATFEDLPLQKTETFWNGQDMGGKFTNGNIVFKNSYTKNSYGDYWSGFSYSNTTNITSQTIENQYSSASGNGAQGSATYAICYSFSADTVSFILPEKLESVYLNNSAYTALTIKNGDKFSKKFGGTTGNDADWYKLSLKGLDINGKVTGTIEVYLADFRDTDNTKDYILTTWKKLDLSSLGTVSKLIFSLSSSDSTEWGMNTPSYFCLDNIKGSIQ
jgi:hypothetical protein